MPAFPTRRLLRAATIVLLTLAVVAVALAAGHTSTPTSQHAPEAQKLLMPAGYDPYYRVPATSPDPAPR